MRNAIGRPPQKRASLRRASSAARPELLTSSSNASASSSTPTDSRSAPVRPPSGERLVTTVGHALSSGRTCASPAALSSTTSSRRLAV